MSKPSERCSMCQRALVPGRFWMCDQVEDGAWCDDCFATTACGHGRHGEGCPTAVHVDGEAVS